MLRRLLHLALGCGLVYCCSSWVYAVEQIATDEPAKRQEYRARIGVVSLTPELLALAEKTLPLGFYKDYSCFGRENPTTQANLAYMPIIQYKSKTDTQPVRSAVSIAWHTGQFPKLPGIELDQLLLTTELSEIGPWLADHTGADGIPDGTVFLLGNEPGFRPNNDDRTAEEIVQDAVLIKELFSRHNLKHRLALGGISTPRSTLVREAYAGRSGNEFFREILDAARDKVAFDAFVVHPYPTDVHQLSAQESYDQIIEFRRIMHEFGQRDKPLFVGEVGLPFPALRGKRDAVCRYAGELIESCLTGRDPQLGLPGDDHRLVQRITWYVLCPPRQPIVGFSDNPALDLEASALMRADGTLTDIGETLVRTIDRLVARSPAVD